MAIDKALGIGRASVYRVMESSDGPPLRASVVLTAAIAINKPAMYARYPMSNGLPVASSPKNLICAPQIQ
jgi:hypothetical protein